MRTEYDYVPPASIKEGTILRLFFGFEPVEKQDMQGNTITKYQGYSVDVKGDHSYGAIVSAIIKSKYPDDVRDAIMSNREILKDFPEHDKAEKYSSEYDNFQAWREYAKIIAKSVAE